MKLEVKVTMNFREDPPPEFRIKMEHADGGNYFLTVYGNGVSWSDSYYDGFVFKTRPHAEAAIRLITQRLQQEDDRRGYPVRHRLSVCQSKGG
jgi:hypothetical protein